MTTLLQQFRRLAGDERGQDFLEYALMTAFVGSMATVIVGFDLIGHLAPIWVKVKLVLQSVGGRTGI